MTVLWQKPETELRSLQTRASCREADNLWTWGISSAYCATLHTQPGYVYVSLKVSTIIWRFRWETFTFDFMVVLGLSFTVTVQVYTKYFITLEIFCPFFVVEFIPDSQVDSPLSTLHYSSCLHSKFRIHLFVTFLNLLLEMETLECYTIK